MKSGCLVGTENAVIIAVRWLEGVSVGGRDGRIWSCRMEESWTWGSHEVGGSEGRRSGLAKKGLRWGKGRYGFVADGGRHIIDIIGNGVGGDISGGVVGIQMAKVGGEEEEEDCFEINVGDVREVDTGEDGDGVGN